MTTIPSARRQSVFQAAAPPPTEVVLVSRKRKFSEALLSALLNTLLNALLGGLMLMLLLPLLGEVLDSTALHPSYWQCVATVALARTLLLGTFNRTVPTALGGRP